jgi:hypothetical protein
VPNPAEATRAQTNRYYDRRTVILYIEDMGWGLQGLIFIQVTRRKKPLDLVIENYWV